MIETIHILDMETKLSEDENGVYRDQLCDELRATQSKIKRSINEGLPRSEFQQAQCVFEAIEASIMVVENVWKTSRSRQLL